MTELEQFDEARKLFGGVKRGNQTEFDYFKKKHKDWKEVLPLLKPAIEQQISYRRKLAWHNQAVSFGQKKFIPEWKHFKTWICNRCWEEEYDLPNEKKVENNSKKDLTSQEEQNRIFRESEIKRREMKNLTLNIFKKDETPVRNFQAMKLALLRNEK